jgi:hypothetical protein
VAFIHNGMLFSYKEEWNPVIYNMIEVDIMVHEVSQIQDMYCVLSQYGSSDKSIWIFLKSGKGGREGGMKRSWIMNIRRVKEETNHGVPKHSIWLHLALSCYILYEDLEVRSWKVNSEWLNATILIYSMQTICIYWNTIVCSINTWLLL